jgi:hypothetical protein
VRPLESGVLVLGRMHILYNYAAIFGDLSKGVKRPCNPGSVLETKASGL